MKIHDRYDVLDLLKLTGRVLSPNQRIVVLLYAASEQNSEGAVITRATELAETVGMTPPVFSRTRKELVQLGWLEEAGSVGRIKLYRLAQHVDTQRGRGSGHLRVVGS